MEDMTKVLEILNGRMKAAEDKRAELEIQTREVDTEISNLSKAIHRILTLMGLNSGEPISELGITDAVRRVVLSNPRMNASQIRAELEKQRFDFSGYQNAMASIYKILERLAGKGEIEVEKEGWNTFYKPKRRVRPHRRRSRLARALLQAGPQTQIEVPRVSLKETNEEEDK